MCVGGGGGDPGVAEWEEGKKNIRHIPHPTPTPSKLEECYISSHHALQMRKS